MDRDPDEREAVTSWSIGISKWIPVNLSLTRTVTQRWKARAEQLLEDAASISGTDAESIAARVEESEQFGDLLQQAGEKVVRSADEDLRKVLARLVARALMDDARIDETQFLVAVVAQLEPIHLRYLRVLDKLESYRQDQSGNITVSAVSAHLSVDGAVAQSVAERLHSLAILTDRLGGDMVSWTADPLGAFSVAPLGRLILSYCAELQSEAKR